jgi:hypothetical protein
MKYLIMKSKINYILFSLIIFSMVSCQEPEGKKEKTPSSQQSSHSFTMDSVNFLLDGKPYQIISGEIHYSRIPKEYWRHRIKMVKAMGCNTVATYAFWNHHEIEEGTFDFTSENRDLTKFIEIVEEEGMWLLFRPGPYSCGEWDMGGIPPYLLSIPDIKLRCMDARYMAAAEKYMKAMAEQIRPHLITNGGPIILLQIENEYGSFGNDRAYMQRLKEIWLENGMDISFYTSDGATTYMLEAGTLPACAVGLDPGAWPQNFELARKMNAGVPVFSSETYPGWLTHWGENWVRPDTASLLREVRFLMDNKLSLNFYMLHGGTNFGYSAGANSGGTGYQPDITSYDYDAPINECGQATHKYDAIKKVISRYRSKEDPIAHQPAPIPMMEIPEIKMHAYSSVWNSLQDPIISVQPKPFEFYHHYYGFAVYKTKLIGHKQGRLTITELHDYATVFVDGEYVGTIDRSKGGNSIDLPKGKSENPELEILIEGMGRINFGDKLIDRKGITDRVTLNGMTLMNWEVYCLPVDSNYLNKLSQTKNNTKPGIFFKGEFTLDRVADTYIDMSDYKKGMVWVNGHNLGRYWGIGPQHSLYCPAPWLKEGLNKIVVFDLHQLEAAPIKGIKELK